MPAPARRRVPLFCTVINTGQLVIVRMPDDFVPWSAIRREISASVRREHGTPAKDIHAIEGFAGDVDGDTDGDEGLRLCERAFGGDETVFAAFALHAWNEETRTFEMVRGPTRSD